MQSGEKIAMAKKMRNFAAILAISGNDAFGIGIPASGRADAQECGEKCWGYAEDRR